MSVSKLKSPVKQYYLRKKFGRFNTIRTGAVLSRDLEMGRGCLIGENAVLGQGVRLGDNVRVGRNACLWHIEVGENSFIEAGVICTGFGEGRLVIGQESYIGINNILDWSDHITIGNYVHIAGPSTGLWTHASAPMCLNGIPLAEKGKTHRPTAPIVIEDHVFVGGNCTVYPGVTIHHHSIVAPNSAVTRDVEPYALVGGVPARLIKKIEAEQ